MEIGNSVAVEVRVGMSMYWGQATLVGVEAWEVRVRFDGRTVTGVGSYKASAIADARSELRMMGA